MRAGIGLAAGTVRHPHRQADAGWRGRDRIVKDLVQVDATCGHRRVSDSQARGFSIGLRVLTSPFLR